MLQVIYNLLGKRLRLSEPWKFKAPFLISIPYFFIVSGDVSFPDALLSVFLVICTIVGIAGFGYFSNDVADRKTDQKAGVPNGAVGLKNSQIVLLFSFFLAVALLPWVFYFPVNRISLCLLILQFLLFISYSAPPLRLKERGLLGPVTDALYAHANPALLAAYTFHLLTDHTYVHLSALLVALGTWQFFLGLRNILQHQIISADLDRVSGTQTWVIKAGGNVHPYLKCLFMPLEIIGFIAFTIVISLTIPAVLIAWPLYILVTFLIIYIHWKQKLFHPLNDRLYLFFDEYLLRWFPLILLVRLTFHDISFGILLLLHLFLFRNGLTPFLRKSFNSVQFMLMKQVWILNKLDIGNALFRSQKNRK